MNILVLGGMHGNEPLGPEVVKLFQRKPVEGVTAVIANPRALEMNVRYTDQDLNRSFPGDSSSLMYEPTRASDLMNLCQGYDLVLDFHNTTCRDNDCSFVGESAKTELFDVSAWFGLKRVIVADYDCINKYIPACLSIEISLNSDLMDTEWWYERISALTELPAVPSASGITRYTFAYRMTLDDRDRLGLAKRNLKAFRQLPKNVASELGVLSPAYPIFIADTYTPYNYGGVLNRIDV